MSKSRNVTLRLSETDFNEFNRLAEELKLTRTDLIRNAVRKYGIAEKLKTTASVKEKATEIVAATVDNSTRIADFSHPLLTKIEKEGLSVHDSDGNLVRRIGDLNGLLNFVQKNVFK